MQEDDPAFAIVPYGEWPTFGIASKKLDELVWPLGRPKRLSTGTVRDMQPDGHLISFPRKPLFYLPWFGVRAKVSVMIVEPDIVHAHHLKNAFRFRRRFHAILSKNRDLLDKINNGVFFVFGFTFIENIAELNVEKSKLASLIASTKSDLPGHKLRHRIVDFIWEQQLDVDVMGRGYAPFENKEDGLAPYRFSVIIENIREPSYFSEKLVDACLCRTVPIYWGAPDIDKFFDTEGLIICNSEEEITKVLQSLSAEDYERRGAAMNANYDSALYYANNLKRAAQAVRDSLETAQ